MLVEVEVLVDVWLEPGEFIVPTTPGESIIPANADTDMAAMTIATAHIRFNLLTIL